MDEGPKIDIETTPVAPAEPKVLGIPDGLSPMEGFSTPPPETDPVQNLGDALTWQREFAERASKVSAEIRAILQTYEMDMVAQTNVLEVTITVPISFKDLKQHSPAQPVPLAETM